MAKEHRVREEGGGGFLGKFISLLLGFILGIIAVLGTVAAIAYYVMTRPIKDTINLVDSTGELYEMVFNEQTGMLNPDYADKLVGDLVMDSMTAMQSISTGGPLSDLSKISPMVNVTVDNILLQTDVFAIPMERDELLSHNVYDLSIYLQESLQITPLGGMLQGLNGKNLDDPLMLSICYGSPSHYETSTDENGYTVYNMKQIVYTYQDEDKTDEDPTKKLYDIDGRVVEGTFDYSAKTLTTTRKGEDVTYYLKLDESATEVETYLAYSDSSYETTATYPYTRLFDLSGSSEDLIGDVYLCDALGIKNEKDAHEVLVSLAYGEKGVDYTADAQGNITPINTPRTILELKKENKELIKSISLGDALGVKATSHKVLRSLAYGVEGEDYDIVKGEIKMREGSKVRTLEDLSSNGTALINGIRLSDVLETNTTSALTMYLLYGRENVHYKLVAGEPIMLQKKIAILDNAAYNEYGEPLVGVVGDDEGKITFKQGDVLYTCAEITDPTLDKTVKTSNGMATLYLLNDENGKSVGDYEPTDLGDFSGENNVVSSLTTRMKLGEILGDVSDNIFLKHITEETVETLPDAIEKLTITQVYHDNIYNADGSVAGEWWYLLHDPDACVSTDPDHAGCVGITKNCTDTSTPCIPGMTGHKNCKYNRKSCISDYTVKQMGSLITNMRRNMEEATLYELKSDGMITGLSEDTLKSEIITDIQGAPLNLSSVNITSDQELLGQLTVNQMLQYVSVLMTAIKNL